MKIIQLRSENVKRVVAVDITPQEDLVLISGENGNGKSSVIDSIWLALSYKSGKKEIPSPLRNGEKSGYTEIDLGDYIVTRKYTQSGSTLEIRKPDGSKIPSPQKLLDGMIGDLSFDPWEFARMNEKDQREMLGDILFNLTKGKLDLSTFDVAKKNASEERRDLKREKKRLEVVLGQMAPPTQSDPTEEVSAADLTDQITNALAIQSSVQERESRIKALEKRQDELARQLQDVQNELGELSMGPVETVPDIPALQDQLSKLEEVNNRAREVKAYNATRESLKAVTDDVNSFNDKIELIDIEKAEALEKSPLPLDNIKVTEDGIMFLNDGHEVPFCQASSAQQLRISLAIAMAANPELRVIRIADGSLLDDKSIDIVRSMVKQNDFQVWIEYASRNDDDRMGVYIKDGKVEEVN